MANETKRITDVDIIDSLNGDESFFVNQNSSIKQISKNDVFKDIIHPIENGGTGATTVASARNNLGLGNTDGALPVANGGTGATNAAESRVNLGITPKNIGAVEKVAFPVKTLGINWDGDSAPYTQTITVDGILEEDNPHVTPIYSDVLEIAIAQKESWGMICRAITGTNFITFICFEEKPESEIPIQLEVYR